MFEIVDSIGMRFSILNAVCMGTTYDQAWIVGESETLGSSSHACLRAFAHGWTRWDGWRKLVRCDRGSHNRGVVASTLAKNGVAIRPAGLEAPEQIGRVERRGAMHKHKHASGRESMHVNLSECLNAANEMTHLWFYPSTSGYSHVFHAILPPWVTKTNVSTWVLFKHMLMDQQLRWSITLPCEGT